MKILIAECNPNDSEMILAAFRELHSPATMVVAEDGEECLRVLFGEGANSQSYPDLVILELNLPVLSGYEVLARIKGDARTRHIPVIVLSSAEGEDEIARAYQAHANAYVRKPRSMADFMTTARGLKAFWLETARLTSAIKGG